MKRKGENKKDKNKKAHHENPLPGEINTEQKEQNRLAAEEANKDINKDPEFTAHSKNDDLDEGEAARLGENDNLT